MGDAAALDGFYAATVATGRGRTVFVAGDDADGRGELLRAWAESLAGPSPPPVVVGGAFEDEQYTPWGDEATAASAAVEKLNGVLGTLKAGIDVGGLLLPPGVALLLGQIMSKVESGVKLLAATISQSASAVQAPLLREAIRGLCRRGPAVLVIESVDEMAGKLWSELAWLLSRRIARDLPVLLVLALDGPRRLGEHEDSEPLQVARELTSEIVDVASWHWLAPLTAADVERWTGPVTGDVVSWLLEVTNGRSGEARRRWRAWQVSGLVENRSEGRWRFAAGFDPMFDIDGPLEGRTRKACGAGFEAITATQRLLGCAALEGRVFTPRAVALAMDPERDPETVLAFIELKLLLDDEHPDGLLLADGPAIVRTGDAISELARYRFARELDWIALRHHGLSDGEQRRHAGRLARALEQLYGETAAGRADTLARLFEIAGDRQRAQHYEQIAGINSESRITIWRARNALNSPDPATPTGRQRIAGILIDGASELAGGGPYDEGVTFARDRAALRRDSDAAGSGRVSDGRALASVGETPRGALRADLRARGVSRTRKPQRPGGRLLPTRRELTPIEGSFDRRARRFHRGARDLPGHRRPRAAKPGRCTGLANCDHEQGSIDRAREGYAAALAIYRDVGDRVGEANTLTGLAICDREQGSIDRAREGYAAALAICRDIGHRGGEASTLKGLAICDREEGNIERARQGYTEALAIYRDISHRQGEANALHGLAMCEREQGNIERAREGYTAAVAIYREIGDHDGEANALNHFAESDREQG